MEQAQPQDTTADNPEKAKAVCLYQPGDQIKHIKNGDVYFIQLTPEHFIRDEATGEPAYAYAKAGAPVGPDSPIWFRRQAEIEDTSRYEHIPKEPDPRDDPEFKKREDEDYKIHYTAFQNEVTRLVAEAKLELGFDPDAFAAKLMTDVEAFAKANYAETHEVILQDPWMIGQAGKGGVPILVADHVNHFQHDISTQFDFPYDAPTGPKFEEVCELEDHIVPGFDKYVVVKQVRPTDGQAGREKAADFYLLEGFLTQGFGGSKPQRGLLVQFQDGPIKEVGLTGVTIESLLAVCGHRLRNINVDGLVCDENDQAIQLIDAALEQLKARTFRRLKEGTIGSRFD